MSDADLARSHVERCLQSLWNVHDLHPDADGHYPYCSGTAACWIGVDGGDPPVVTAVACAAVGVKKSMKLFGELNELNARGRTTRVYWDDGEILVEQTMLANTVDRRALAHAGQSVAAVANDIGPVIAAVFGGCTPLAEIE
jgi:YD repeat-containing protein